MASCRNKCKDIDVVELCVSVSEKLTGIGKPAEQTLRKYTPERKLHVEGSLSCPLFVFSPFHA